MKKLTILFMLFFTSLSFANLPQSAVALGAGGAGVASVEPGEASFMNSASLVHLKGRHFYTSFQKDLFAISLTENDRDSAVPGAFSYFSDKEVQMFALSLSDFVYDRIAFGATLTYWQAEFDLEDKRKTAINGNVGILWTPINDFGIGFAAENIVSASDEFERNNRLIPTSRFGVNWNYQEWFRLRMDLVTQTNNRWDNWIPQVGVESYTSKWFIFRIGVSRPPKLKESWSAGFGFDLPRFKIDYASQWHADGGNDQRHSVDLSIPF